MHHALRAPSLLLACLSLAACAEGGKEVKSSSEVTLSRTHYLVGLLGTRAFPQFPIPPASVGSDRGTLILGDDGNYKIGRGTSTSGAAAYQLAKTGSFAVIVPRGSNLPSARYAGGYGLDGDTGAYFFTDRFTDNTATSVGLFFGLPVVRGTGSLQGDWHLFSQHVIFSKSVVQSPDNVGRTVAGTLTVDAAGKITAGKGIESTKASLTFSGTVKSFEDGRIDLAVTYEDAQEKDERVFLASAIANLAVGLDEDETDGEAGLLLLIRKRAAKGELAKLAGTYWLGAHTLFVNPARSGTDAATGTLVINDKGAFRIEATGAGDVDFVYTGSLTLADDGALVIKVDGTNETWGGAADTDYRTIVLADHVVEQRTGGKPPELNLFVALRAAPAAK